MAKTYCGGHTIEEITGELGERMRKDYFMYTDGVSVLHPTKWVVPSNFTKYADLIYNVEVKPDDIYVNTYPKSGTTWMQEIIWNLVHNPDLDNPQSDLSLDARFPNFEADMLIATTGAAPPDPEGDPMKLFAALCPGKHYLDGILVHLAAYLPSPRLLKNHLPLPLLPPGVLEKAKVVYVARDPRDVLISYYHFCRLHLLFGYKGNLDDFVDDFVNDRSLYAPYWEHMKLAWDRRNHKNLCFVFYEDMKEDIVREVKRVDKFLGTNRTDQQIQNVVQRTSFSEMKERSKTNQPTSNENNYFDKEVEKKEGGFFRKGISGDWKSKLSPAHVEKMNAWMAKNLPQFGEDFKYKV